MGLALYFGTECATIEFFPSSHGVDEQLMGPIIDYDSHTREVCAVGVNVGMYDLHNEISLF